MKLDLKSKIALHKGHNKYKAEIIHSAAYLNMSTPNDTFFRELGCADTKNRICKECYGQSSVNGDWPEAKHSTVNGRLEALGKVMDVLAVKANEQGHYFTLNDIVYYPKTEHYEIF